MSRRGQLCEFDQSGSAVLGTRGVDLCQRTDHRRYDQGQDAQGVRDK